MFTDVSQHRKHAHTTRDSQTVSLLQLLFYFFVSAPLIIYKETNKKEKTTQEIYRLGSQK